MPPRGSSSCPGTAQGPWSPGSGCSDKASAVALSPGGRTLLPDVLFEQQKGKKKPTTKGGCWMPPHPPAAACGTARHRGWAPSSQKGGELRPPWGAASGARWGAQGAWGQRLGQGGGMGQDKGQDAQHPSLRHRGTGWDQRGAPGQAGCPSPAPGLLWVAPRRPPHPSPPPSSGSPWLLRDAVGRKEVTKGTFWLSLFARSHLRSPETPALPSPGTGTRSTSEATGTVQVPRGTGMAQGGYWGLGNPPGHGDGAASSSRWPAPGGECPPLG